MISILILTLNEEANITECLESVAWSKDVVVLDSGSKDQTLKLARRKGARIAKHPFRNFADQQNWAVENIEFKYPWVFYLDADERMTPQLKEEILNISNNPSVKKVGFFCGRRNYLWGRWIKHAFPPSLLFRFFKPKQVRFKVAGHGPSPVMNGGAGYLKQYFDHYNFSKGIAEWIDKHNRYSSLEAHEGFFDLEKAGFIKVFFSTDPYERRKALKKFSYRIPFRPIIKFFYLYFAKFGFLDGFPGLTYCFLQSIYEYMIVLKVKELRMESRGLKPE